MSEITATLPLGVVLRKQPGVTRWAAWVWRAVAVLPGAPPAEWHVMRRDGAAVEYHAATLPLELHRAETEAYRVALSNEPPRVYVVLRPAEEEGAVEEIAVHSVTASPYEAQDYLDSGEEIVEPVTMPPALVAWISSFVARHQKDEPFVKRQRDKLRVDGRESGKGDARIRQTADVYRAPGAKRRLQ